MFNPSSRYASQTIRLNCLVLGELSSDIFGINIAWTDDVSSLKESIKEKKKPDFDIIAANLLKIWNVDLAVDDDLDDILAADDPFVRLNLPKKTLPPLKELFTIFPERPARGKLHIIIRVPGGSVPDPVMKLYRKNATLFKCLQLTVSSLKSWTKEDVHNNLNGGSIFDHENDRTCPILDRIELQLARPRTYNSLAVQENQDFRIACSYAPHFDDIFVASQTPSPAVNDNREFTAFFNVIRCYHPDTERIQIKEGTSLKASTLIVYFIVPPFFSRSTEHFACKVEIPWAFPIFLAKPDMAQSWCRYQPKSGFMVTSTSFLCPFIISEVVSNYNETDRQRMLLQAIAVTRAGQYLVKAGEQFFVVAIYLPANLIAERYIVAQTESREDSSEDMPTRPPPKVSIAQKKFNLATEGEAVSFLREMYNLAPILDTLAGKLDPKKKACLSDITSAATGLISLTRMAQQQKTAGQTMDTVPEGVEGDGGYDDLGVFGADDIQDVLKAMEFTVDFVLFGHPYIAVVSNVIDDSTKGYLKFVPSGRKEIKTLQYLTQIYSHRNHTITGVGIWPVRGGHVISMPMAGTWITELRQPSGQLWSVAEQLFEAIDFMHQHGVAHMDLKPANILMPLHGGRLSIIDFNTSVRVKGAEDMFRGVVGTPGYIAPEVEDDRGPYSAVRADLWSCGKTLYQLCKLCQPSTDRSVLLGIAGQLMDEDPAKRPMMSDVLEMMAQCKANADAGMGSLRFSSVGPPEVSA